MAAPRQSLLDVPASRRRLFAGTDQPARLSFEFDNIRDGPHEISIITTDILRLPFCVLTRFARHDTADLPKILVVPPLSCHFPILLRDFILGLLPNHEVFLADWINARHIAAEIGPFDLDGNVDHILTLMRALSPDLNVIGFCQAGVPTLMACACASQEGLAPRRIVLVAAPIDVMANPTRVSRLILDRGLEWYETHTIISLPEGEPGFGRRVYPGSLQWLGLWAYLARHVSEGRELLRKLVADDGSDAVRFPFLDLYSALMDIPAELFLDVMRFVYHERILLRGAFPFQGRDVSLGTITAPLMTLEGADDDIAAPGQTSAAHALCPSIADHLRTQRIIPHCGHFSLFHGEPCRRVALPAVREFLV